MNGRRIVALFRRLVEEIRRDRPSLALLFIAPILVTGLVTFILREGQAPSVHAVIVNQAGPAGAVAGRALGTALTAQGATVAQAPDEATARQMIEDGSATVAVILPADLASASPPTITVMTTGLDPTGDAGQIAAVQKALLGVAASVTGARLPTVQHVTAYGSPNQDPISPYAPAMVGFFIYFFVDLLTGVSFLRERTGGTLERLMATPVAQAEIVIGYTLGFGLFAILQVTVLMCWVLGTVHVPAIGPLPEFAIGLGVPIDGNPLLAFLVVVVLALGAVSLAIFLSTFARTELQVIQFIPIVIVPQGLLGGIFWPLDKLPDVLSWIGHVLPITYAVDGLREVMLKGADLSNASVQLDLVVLAAIALLFVVLASLTIRREVA